MLINLALRAFWVVQARAIGTCPFLLAFPALLKLQHTTSQIIFFVKINGFKTWILDFRQAALILQPLYHFFSETWLPEIISFERDELPKILLLDTSNKHTFTSSVSPFTRMFCMRFWFLKWFVAWRLTFCIKVTELFLSSLSQNCFTLICAFVHTFVIYTV